MRSWNLDNFPNFRGKIKKSLSCHHLEIGIPSDAQNLRNSQSCLNMAILISMLDFWGVSLSWRKHLFFPPKKKLSPKFFGKKKPNDSQRHRNRDLTNPTNPAWSRCNLCTTIGVDVVTTSQQLHCNSIQASHCHTHLEVMKPRSWTVHQPGWPKSGYTKNTPDVFIKETSVRLQKKGTPGRSELETKWLDFVVVFFWGGVVDGLFVGCFLGWGVLLFGVHSIFLLPWKNVKHCIMSIWGGYPVQINWDT